MGGLLASSPAAFSGSGDISRGGFDIDRPPYSMTNKGLNLEMVLIRSDESFNGASTLMLPLNCTRKGQGDPLTIYLRRIYRDQFSRVLLYKLVPWVESRSVKQKIIHERTQIYVKEPNINVV